MADVFVNHQLAADQGSGYCISRPTWASFYVINMTHIAADDVTLTLVANVSRRDSLVTQACKLTGGMFVQWTCFSLWILDVKYNPLTHWCVMINSTIRKKKKTTKQTNYHV